MSTTPSYYTHNRERRGSNQLRLTVKIVNSIDELMKVFAIRAATYMSEQKCPYEEEFDGNDFCGAHLLGFVDEEPAGCLRARFFADFVKLERLAVRPEFRNTKLAFRLVRAGIDFARKKGFTRIYGHSQERLQGFWRMFGAVPLENGQEFVFSDFRYREMQIPLKPDPEAIGMGVDPYVILRPEGQWHRPGLLEESSVRPVTSPLRG